jgi:hypothetical protein
MKQIAIKRPKPNTTIASDLKNAIWDLYIGRGLKTSPCPICGTSDMQRNSTAGFEAAHMIADKWMTDKTKLNVYYLYPSCRSCNLNCRTDCILDFLYCRMRFRELRILINAVCTTYISEHDDSLDLRNRLWAFILKRLYGSDTWKSGGGLVNENAIYRIADEEQYKWLNEREEASLKVQKAIFDEKIYLSENKTLTSRPPTILL